MRVFVAWFLALGLVAAPAMARTGGAGDGKDTSAGTKLNDTATATKDKTADATAAASKEDAAKSTPSNLENELGQLRDLLEAQAKQLQAQSDQLKEQQQKMQELESELKSGNAPRENISAVASSSATGSTVGISTAPVANVTSAANGSSEAPAQTGNESPMAIQFKGITLTPGGFMAAETVFRNKAIGADINTPFNSVPFPGNSGSQTTEFNASARQSRISLLAEGKLSNVKLTGYVETDFLGAGITSNDNQSNSYVLRLRQGWGQAKFDNGWTLTGGQMWSLVTETKHGVDNRTEALPMVIDPQYTVGFSWARQYGFRVAKSFGDKLTLAASVEEAATTTTVHGNPTSVIPASTNVTVNGVTTSILSSTTFTNFLVGAPGVSSGLYNPTGTYAYTKTPDFIFKAALDPGWGHYEVFGIVGTFRDRVYPCYYANGPITITLPGTVTPPDTLSIPANPCTFPGLSSTVNPNNPTAGAFNNSRVGGGIGANARWPFMEKKIEFGIHFLGGDGIGRYGTAGLPDSTVRETGDINSTQNGTLALIRSYQVLSTLELHPTPKLDIYMNVGGEYAGRAAYMTPAGKADGYGAPGFRNDGCFVEPLPVAPPAGSTNTTGVLGSTGFIPGSLSNCTGDTRNIIEGSIGFWYRFYNGDKGRMQWGPQYSYVVKNTWYGAGSASGTVSSPRGIDNMLFTSFRYYLP